jgi:hypothetical protein
MALRGRLAGLAPLFPGSLADDLLLLHEHLSGPSEIRTRDLLNAIETRSQLRYGPILFFQTLKVLETFRVLCYSASVDLGGFEPPASSVRLRRAPNCATGPFQRVQRFYLREGGMSR